MKAVPVAAKSPLLPVEIRQEPKDSSSQRGTFTERTATNSCTAPSGHTLAQKCAEEDRETARQQEEHHDDQRNQVARVSQRERHILQRSDRTDTSITDEPNQIKHATVSMSMWRRDRLTSAK